MTAVLTRPNATVTAPSMPVSPSASGFSPESRAVRQTLRSIANQQERSVALFGDKVAAISTIWELVRESEAFGDGKEADPIHPIAARQAVDFVRALPEGVRLPEIAWEPDGFLSLDWSESRHRVFSVSFGGRPRLPYAWLDGPDRGHAVAFFDGETVPPRILEGIKRIVHHGDTSVGPT
jgi:hypothetical protein